MMTKVTATIPTKTITKMTTTTTMTTMAAAVVTTTTEASRVEGQLY